MQEGLAPLSHVGITRDATNLIRARVNAIADNLLERWSELSAIPLNPLATNRRRRNGRAVEGTIRPYLITLFPTVARASTIERSFSSSMGTALQDCAAIIANGAGLESRTEEEKSGLVSSGVRDYINTLAIENRREPAADIERELTTIRTLNLHPDKIRIDVRLDFYIRSGGIQYYFDMKTPSPNSAQPPLMKRKLLEVQSICMSEGVTSRGFAVFHYNPKGTETAFSEGRHYFDYDNNEVLVGDQFWDFIAGPGTFTSFMDIWTEVGLERRADLNALLGI